MLLLNAIRAFLTLLGLFLVEGLRRGYGLEGFPLIVVLAVVLVLVFTAGDVAEERIVEHFNKDEA